MAKLAGGDKVWLVEIFQSDAHFRVVKDAGVRRSNRFLQLGDTGAFDINLSCSAQRDISVGLDHHALVELRREDKLHFDLITSAQPVQRTANPRQGWTPNAIRCSGLCDCRCSRLWSALLSLGGDCQQGRCDKTNRKSQKNRDDRSLRAPDHCNPARRTNFIGSGAEKCSHNNLTSDSWQQE